LAKDVDPGSDGIAAVMPTIFSSFAASLTRLWPNTFWYAGAFGLAFALCPVATSNLTTA